MIATEINPKDSLKKFFGFDKFKGEQEEIIDHLLSGNSCFVIMPTGGGKSLCYQLPALMMDGTAIVVSPLIALMKNQVDAIRGFSKNDGIAHFLNSSLNKGQLQKVKEDVSSGITKLLYVAPESLKKEDNIEFLASIGISFFAIDEAHCISEWGHDFRPEYRKLKSIMKDIADTPVIALTATATEKVQTDIMKNLGIDSAKVFKASFNRDNLFYEVRPKRDVTKEIIKYAKQHEGKSGIVYCLSRKKVEEVAEALQVNGIKALPYHAGMDGKMRASTQDKFLMEECDVIVATIAFGMGIDKPDVRYVVHHDIPKSIESYYQETGRAGRDGGEGNCVAFYSYKDIEKLEKFLQGKPVSEQEIGNQLLQDIVSYSETSICRRKFLLHYFGEHFNEENCNDLCDNCKDPKEKYEGQEYVELLLKTVKAVKQKHGMKHVSNILVGNETAEVKTYNHHEIDQFGEGEEHEDKFWNAVIRQCIVRGLLNKEIETYGQLKISKEGEAFMAKPESFMLTKERDYQGEEDASIVVNSRGAGGGDDVLLSMLKELRKDTSKKVGLPPYVIFQDPSLDEMSLNYPTSLDDLTKISGVGKGKAEKYGKPFIDLINKYVKENDIERPMDLVVKTVANKSANKVHIITNIDRKLPLEDIASSKGLDLEGIIEEIEVIVASGTRVNIGYYLDDILDQDSQEDIFEYFKEAESDDLNDAIDEFDGDFTEDEIRLVRIRFMSEMAN
ncbi:MAG: DNA helicase RecQ [Flavobacteriales bacterium]|nr:DNA helicase RecQ [Flavobacteriales bacterium]